MNAKTSQPKARKPQRAGKNTIAHHAKVVAGADRVLSLPAGVTLDDPEEKDLWLHFSRARPVEDWAEHDKYSLVELVKLEVQRRQARAQMVGQDLAVISPHGGMTENPLLKVIDRLTRQQLAIMRSLHMNVIAGGSTTVKKHARQEQQARQLQAEQASGASFLAGPTKTH